MIKEILIAASIPSAIVTLLIWMLQRKITKNEEKRDAQNEKQEKLQILLIDSVNATMDLSEATARAVQRIPDAHCNGDMHAALEQVERTRKREQNLLTQSGIHDIMRD